MSELPEGSIVPLWNLFSLWNTLVILVGVMGMVYG